MSVRKGKTNSLIILFPPCLFIVLGFEFLELVGCPLLKDPRFGIWNKKIQGYYGSRIYVTLKLKLQGSIEMSLPQNHDPLLLFFSKSKLKKKYIQQVVNDVFFKIIRTLWSNLLKSSIPLLHAVFRVKIRVYLGAHLPS